jgi:hypothetical protein
MYDDGDDGVVMMITEKKENGWDIGHAFIK